MPTRISARPTTLRALPRAGAAPSSSTGRTEAPPRMPPSVGRSGIEGVFDAAALHPKSSGPEGVEPLLGPAQERRARDVFARAPAPVRLALEELVAGVGGPGAVVARALLLRAIAARAHVLVEEDAAPAMSTLRAFAGRLEGLSSDELLRRASVIDLDSTKRQGAAHVDPQSLWRTRGAVVAPTDVGAAPDQDGLFQRFTGSCGPATVQMMLAENDPVFAFAIHDEGVTSDSTTDRTATFQRLLLERYGGGKSLGRVEGWLRARTNNALGRLVAVGSVNADGSAALRAHLFGGAPLTAGSRDALRALRDRYGFPDDEEVARLRARAWPAADDGITTEALVEIVNDLCAPASGARYEARVFARGHAYRHIDDVARALRAGVDVPFGCSDPGHWMLLSAVKGRKPERAFLVSDPDGGRTVWVSEQSLRRGTFLVDDLHLARKGQVPWVDSFLLPARSRS